jgi:hypothetical protein
VNDNQKSEPSKLQAALDARKRISKTVPLPFYSDGAGNGSVAIRVPTIREEVRARLEAAKWIELNSAGVPPEIAGDVDLASVWLVYDTFMQTKERRPGYTETLFLTPDRMLSTLSSDELCQCIELLNEVREEFSGRVAWDEDEAMQFADALIMLDDEGAAELLSDRSKSWLVKFAKWMADRDRIQV